MPKSNQEALAQIEARLAHEESRARSEFIATFEMLAIDEAHARTPIERRPLGPFDGYVVRADPLQRLLSIVHEGVELLPAFQWHAGQLLPVVSVVCRMFDSHCTRWETAFWFVSDNGWLDGAAPIDVMLSDPAEVVLAAHYYWVEVAIPAP